MLILKHSLITLLIFTSTILSAKPSMICYMQFDENSCDIQIIEEVEDCCSSSQKEEISIEQVCESKTKSSTCDLSKEENIKKCFTCLYSQPIKSAVLHEIPQTEPANTVAQFNSLLINSSKTNYRNYLTSSIPTGIHTTISSTVLRL